MADSEQNDPPCATQAEVREAIETLYQSPEDLAKFLGWARLLSRKLPIKADGSAADDLMHEAILRAWDFKSKGEGSGTEPRRKWYSQKHSFLYFLVGAMMSDVSTRLKQAQRLQNVGDSEAGEEPPSPIDPVAQAEASDTLARIFEYFQRKNDHLALAIFELKKIMGYTGPEIRERLGITLQEYDAAAKRIFRALKDEGWK
jgi:DNA-directed RNA polymerase specialized sigma24 family protein